MSETFISIVIPVLNEAVLVTKALQELQGFRDQGHELIVVDGGSDDATAALALPLCDQLLTSKPGRAIQMNLGASSAVNDALLFLHIDTQLPSDAMELVSSALKKKVWGRFDVALSGSHFLLGMVSTGMNIRSRISSVATGDQAIFVRRKYFEKICGFPVIPLMEDVALSKKLRKLDRPACLKAKVICSSRRWEQGGMVKTILLMWLLRLAYFLNINPERLMHSYYPRQIKSSVVEYPDAVVLLFAKPPRLGRVKTRLAEDLGEEAALIAYTSLLFRQLSRVVSMDLCHVQLWTSEQSSWFRTAGLSEFHQSGGDLGARMAAAASQAFTMYSKVILIGSDCPYLDESYIKRALEGLESNELVIGPAADGGYALLGMGCYIDRIFREIPWSTAQVLPVTLEKIKSQSVSAVMLPVVEDVDTLEAFDRANQAGVYITG